MSEANKKLTIVLCQLPSSSDVAKNVKNALNAIMNAKRTNRKIQLAILPECFSCPYVAESFADYAEEVPEGPTCKKLSKLAKSLSIYIIAGSLIERSSSNRLYNTCPIFGPDGSLIAKHRKMHLFDIDIDVENNGGTKFRESVVLSKGNDFTVVEVCGHNIGIGICHDKRFSEMAQVYRNLGCEMIVYPSAFCICQGPMHWELLQRARATDNQLFVVTCSPSRNNMSGYVAYGHSMIVDPWARVQREAGIGREIIIEEIDFQMEHHVRRQLPLFNQRITDLYETNIIKEQD